MRGHDISGKHIYKQLNPVENIRGAAKPSIFVFPLGMSGIRRCIRRMKSFGPVVISSLPFHLFELRCRSIQFNTSASGHLVSAFLWLLKT